MSRLIFIALTTFILSHISLLFSDGNLFRLANASVTAEEFDSALKKFESVFVPMVGTLIFQDQSQALTEVAPFGL